MQANLRTDLLGLLSNKFDRPPIISDDLIKRIIVRGKVEDSEFDRIYPARFRAISDVQWSNVSVAYEMVSMLGPECTLRFIDLGSGIGKLCTLLAYLTNMDISGVEQRIRLVEIAEEVAKMNCLKNLKFIHGNILDLNWSDYDVFYLYNPFQEHLCEFGHIGVIDDDIDLEWKNYVQYTSEVFRQLIWLAPGKKVFTFHGYGGDMPISMKLVDSRQIDNGKLCLWEKVDK